MLSLSICLEFSLEGKLRLVLRPSVLAARGLRGTVGVGSMGVCCCFAGDSAEQISAYPHNIIFVFSYHA